MNLKQLEALIKSNDNKKEISLNEAYIKEVQKRKSKKIGRPIKFY